MIDDQPCVCLTGASSLDRLGNAAVHRICDRLRKLALKAGRRAEVVQKISVRAADLRGHCLKGDGLGTLFEQQPACRGQRSRAALLWSKPGPSY